MAPNDNDDSRTAEDERSAATSPLDTRGPPPRFESIIHQDNEDNPSEQPTARRSRPPAISTGTGIYGMMCIH